MNALGQCFPLAFAVRPMSRCKYHLEDPYAQGFSALLRLGQRLEFSLLSFLGRNITLNIYIDPQFFQECFFFPLWTFWLLRDLPLSFNCSPLALIATTAIRSGSV